MYHGEGGRIVLDNLPTESQADRKLRLEADELERNRRPGARFLEFLKSLGSASAIVIAVVGGITAYTSFKEWQTNQVQDREAKRDARLDHTFDLLSSKSSQQRAAAISYASILLSADAPDRNKLIFLGIANALPLEEDTSVRNAMVRFFEEADPSVAGDDALKAAGQSLIASNSTAFMKSDLRSRPIQYKEDIQRRSDGPTLHAEGLAICGLLKKTASIKQVANAFLMDCNMDGANLDKMNFSGSTLAFAYFRNAHLQASDLEYTDLEGAYFGGADLRGAQIKEGTYDGVQYTHLRVAQAPEGAYTFLERPSFVNADLRNASVTGLPLLEAVDVDEMRRSPEMSFGELSFHGAKLEGASMSFYVIGRGREPTKLNVAGKLQLRADLNRPLTGFLEPTATFAKTGEYAFETPFEYLTSEELARLDHRAEFRLLLNFVDGIVLHAANREPPAFTSQRLNNYAKCLLSRSRGESLASCQVALNSR